MNILRHTHEKQQEKPVVSLTPFMLAILAIASLSGCSQLCWFPNANKTCPSILNIGE